MLIFTFSIIVPGPPTNFIVQHITSNTIQLSWGVPSVTNGIILYYTVVYSNTTDTIEIVYNNNITISTITGLNEDTVYNFTIYANTSAGAGSTSMLLARTFEDRKCIM